LPQDLEVKLSNLGFSSAVKITDMWSGTEVGRFNDVFVQNLSPHASGLYKIENAE
jgi:hypothetical protein